MRQPYICVQPCLCEHIFNRHNSTAHLSKPQHTYTEQIQPWYIGHQHTRNLHPVCSLGTHKKPTPTQQTHETYSLSTHETYTHSAHMKPTPTKQTHETYSISTQETYSLSTHETYSLSTQETYSLSTQETYTHSAHMKPTIRRHMLYLHNYNC